MLIVLAIDWHATAGRLEDALAQYQRSKDFGIERAAVHIRNVSQHTYASAAPKYLITL